MKKLCYIVVAMLMLTTYPVAWALEVHSIQLAGAPASVIMVDPAHDRLEVFLNDEKNQIYHSFVAVDQALQSKQQHLSFAMNAGMFHPDYQPVGLYIEQGKRLCELNTASRRGNFLCSLMECLCLALK